jgi:HAD superfamily hydrolase (TIGR01509 family)
MLGGQGGFDAVTVRGARAVLFDLDGVLIDSYEVWFRLLNATAEALGYPEVSAETFRDGWGQGIEADQRRFYPGHTIPEIEAYFHAHFIDHVEHLKVADGVPALFAALRERSLPSAVITNTPAPLARELVKRAGGTPDTLIGGTDVERPKPAPDMVLLACERLGVAPGDSLVVGDSRYDRDAAGAAGARFAGLGIEGDVQLASLTDLLDHL